MMDIVERFMGRVNWYHPTEDTLTWKEFYEKTYMNAYPTVETLKSVAWQSRGIKSTADAAMWDERATRWQKFLAGDMALSGGSSFESNAIQYEFVACFLNAYARAEHNNNLWQSINESAVQTLVEEFKPPATGGGFGERAVDPVEPSSLWELEEIPYILYRALRKVNLSFYAPTEDTLTWAAFQEIMFDLTGITTVQFVYRHAYLLSRVASTVDSGMWSPMATEASKLLNESLGQLPATTTEQVKLAQRFCELFNFDYTHAAHNEDLFEAYQQAFTTAREELETYLPREGEGVLAA